MNTALLSESCCDLACRRGTAARTVLLLDSWRPDGAGAAAVVFDWAKKELQVRSPRLQCPGAVLTALHACLASGPTAQ